MTSCDTNILYAACNQDAVGHEAARAFLSSFAQSPDFVLCEQVLMELYGLLRNPSVNKRPLSAREAVALIQRFRSNPRWRIVDVPPDRTHMDKVWKTASCDGFAFRRLFDLRLAETLLAHGVDSFATRNLKDFAACGFGRLFDPCAKQT
jgi:toxin-antitoxin system PIN domain toxin